MFGSFKFGGSMANAFRAPTSWAEAAMLLSGGAKAVDSGVRVAGNSLTRVY